jgi:hypothetical protein
MPRLFIYLPSEVGVQRSSVADLCILASEGTYLYASSSCSNANEDRFFIIAATDKSIDGVFEVEGWHKFRLEPAHPPYKQLHLEQGLSALQERYQLSNRFNCVQQGFIE